MNTTGPTNEAMERHLETLKGITDSRQRHAYLEDVERNESKFVAQWLKDEYAAWWWGQQK